MAAMLVVDVVVPVIVMGVTMIMVIVIMMIMRLTMVVMAVIMVLRHACDRRHRLGRLKRADEGAAFDPDQPQAEQRDQAVARDLDHAFGLAHGLGRRIQDPGRDADDQDRDHRLHQGRGKRERDAAPRGLAVGDEIGGDHRLAVAGAGGMEDAIGKRDEEQRPHRRTVGLGGADGRRHLAIEFRLFCQ
ncbi:hypothetical protein ABIF50_000586 [Bradyrhizobium diazoefficiens]